MFSKGIKLVKIKISEKHLQVGKSHLLFALMNSFDTFANKDTFSRIVLSSVAFEPIKATDVKVSLGSQSLRSSNNW